MFLTGPEVIKAVTGEDVTAQNLGGAAVHTGRSGVAHLVAETEQPRRSSWSSCCSATCRRTTHEDPPQVAPYDPADRMDEALNALVPARRERALRHARRDRRGLRPRQLPRDPPRLRPQRGRRLRAAGRLLGGRRGQPAGPHGRARSTSTPATRSRASSGSATPTTSRSSPSSTAPGFLPGVDQEYGGVIRHGAKIIYAYSEATVPKISIVTRKAMGGAYVAMSSKQMRTDLAFAWPTAQIAVMGAEPAVRVLYREEVRRRSRPAGQGARVHRRLPREVLQPVPRRRRRPDRRGDRAARDAAAPDPRARGAAHEGAAEPAEEARAASRPERARARWRTSAGACR